MFRSLFLILLIFLAGCSSSQLRQPASSFYWRPGVVNALTSQVRLLSIKTVNNEQAYFFYFESKDQFGELIDFDPYELKFVANKTHVPYDFFRDDLGKYFYRIYFKDLAYEVKALKIFLGEEALAEIVLKHQDQLAAMDISHSRMRVVKYENHIYYFELELLDSKNRAVRSIEKPEFLIEGEATLQNLSSIGAGRWRGELRILDTNSIIYLSPRLNSNQLPRLLRIQHIEK